MVCIGTYLFIGWPTEVALSGNPFFRGDLYEKLKLRLDMGLGDPYEIMKLDITIFGVGGMQELVQNNNFGFKIVFCWGGKAMYF